VYLQLVASVLPTLVSLTSVPFRICLNIFSSRSFYIASVFGFYVSMGCMITFSSVYNVVWWDWREAGVSGREARVRFRRGSFSSLKIEDGHLESVDD